MGNCIIRGKIQSSSLDKVRFLMPNQGSNGQAGFINCGNSYNGSSTGDMGAIYNIHLYYVLSSRYSGVKCYIAHSQNNSSGTEFDSVNNSGKNGDIICTARYIRHRGNADGSALSQINCIAIILD